MRSCLAILALAAVALVGCANPESDRREPRYVEVHIDWKQPERGGDPKVYRQQQDGGTCDGPDCWNRR